MEDMQTSTAGKDSKRKDSLNEKSSRLLDKIPEIDNPLNDISDFQFLNDPQFAVGSEMNLHDENQQRFQADLNRGILL